MKKFTVTIEEICTEAFEIEADNSEAAMEAAIKRYKNGELVLSPGEVQFRQMAISEPADYATEWIEF